MRCLSCKYDLSNLTEHRCPECGRAFDPRDAKTFLPDQRSWITPRSVINFMALGLLLYSIVFLIELWPYLLKPAKVTTVVVPYGVVTTGPLPLWEAAGIAARNAVLPGVVSIVVLALLLVGRFAVRYAIRLTNDR